MSDVTAPTIRLPIESSDLAASTREVTRQLCAAAHLYHNLIYKPLQARFSDLRADTPEYFVDMESLNRGTLIAHSREILRRWITAVTVAAAGLATMIREDTELLVPVVCVLVVIELLFELHRQRYVRSHFLGEGVSLEELRGVDSISKQNVVISGGFSPFIGSGYDVFSWSFVVDLTKPSAEEPPQPLTPTELYEEVTVSLGELKIPNLVVSDKLFVHGEELRESMVILPYPRCTPNTHVPEEEVQRAVGVTLNHLRHYRVLQIPAWEGQLVLSLFLRFTTIGKGLFVEARLFLLPPLLPKFRVVDNLTKHITLRQFWGILLWSAIKAPFTWIGAGLAGLGAVNRFFWPEINSQREAVEDNERFNYGWNQSLREQWSGKSYERYFQMLDKDMYSKILQSRIIDAIVNALEARGISTEAIKEQRTTIINHGLIVSGGKVEAQNLAIGQKAVAAVQQAIRGVAKGSPSAGSGQKL